MSRNNGSNGPGSPLGLVGNIAEFGNDVATLAELQAKLAAHDAQECVSRATIPLVVVGAGAALALGTIPVILIGLADLIAESTRIKPGVAQLGVGLVFLAIAALAAFLAFRASLRTLESFRRSSEEFTRNVSWIRTVLVHSGRTIARPRG